MQPRDRQQAPTPTPKPTPKPPAPAPGSSKKDALRGRSYDDQMKMVDPGAAAPERPMQPGVDFFV